MDKEINRSAALVHQIVTTLCNNNRVPALIHHTGHLYLLINASTGLAGKISNPKRLYTYLTQ